MIRRVALISGGTGGLGTAMCRALADAGHRVVANDLPALAERCKAWQARQKDDGYTFDLALADVTDYDACVEMVEDVQARVGAVEILVNNAGVTRDGVFKKMSLERWQAVLDASLGGMFNLTRQVFEGMRLGPGHQHLVFERSEGPVRSGQLLRCQSRRARTDHGAGAGRCA